jgi:hypothetical protein
MDLGEITFGHSGSSGHTTNVTFALALILFYWPELLHEYNKVKFFLKKTLKTAIPKDYTHNTTILPYFFQKGKKKIQENSPAAFRAAPFSKRS